MKECPRCGNEIEDSEEYCECCYDDLFVSWNDVLKKE